MSSITIILILLINYLDQTITSNQCEFFNSIDLQFAIYTHSLILRVQPLNSSEEIEQKVLIREIMKIPKQTSYKIKINDMIIIRIDKNLDQILYDSCWHLLRITTIDIILFLNETKSNEFDLRHPPMESTIRVRQNIDAVINYDIYSPQVIIKTRIDKPILSNSYSLQCNARGNPLPRLNWSKINQTSKYYPSAKQCKTSCRIYSIQNKYQSILYFQSLTHNDSGMYVCHAENAINHTMTSVYIDIDQLNMTCASLKYCHNRGRCLFVDNQLKCLCDNHYFGDQCETNYDDIIKKQNNIILLFKSRFIIGCFLFLIGFIFLLIIFMSCVLSKKKQTKEEVNGQQSLPSSPVRIVTKESAIETNENPNKSEELNIETTSNHLILSEGYLEFYQPDAESGLIRPLTLQTDTPKHYTKYVSFHNRFLVPRPVNQE